MKYLFSASEKQKMFDNPWLTDRQKDVFELYYRRGWNIQDIANELDVSYRTIGAELKTIRKYLVEGRS